MSQKLMAHMAGCWFDAANRSDAEIGALIQEEAADYGWQGAVAGPEHDDFDDAVSAAAEYLAGIAPDGYCVGYADNDPGSFGMWRVDDDGEQVDDDGYTGQRDFDGYYGNEAQGDEWDHLKADIWEDDETFDSSWERWSLPSDY